MRDSSFAIVGDMAYDDRPNRQIVFEGVASGRECRGAVEYDVLEAISTDFDDSDAMAAFKEQLLKVSELADRAVRSHPELDAFRITEDDLDRYDGDA